MTPSRLLLAVVLLSGCQAHTGEWVGNPVTARPDGYYSHEGYVVDYEIGFRDDGMVIWRKKAAP